MQSKIQHDIINNYVNVVRWAMKAKVKAEKDKIEALESEVERFQEMAVEIRNKIKAEKESLAKLTSKIDKINAELKRADEEKLSIKKLLAFRDEIEKL